jgi:heme-degrading monooxygenase HmoA
VYSAAFIFEPGEYDARFHELNALIDAAAKATPGYLGVESWRSKDGATANATYYWESLEALQQFSRHPDHIEAKSQYQRWYRGYHIVVSQVLRSYGDGTLKHITPNERSAR